MSAAESPAPAVSPAKRFFPELESLRGIAVLLVFLLHADGWLHPLFAPRPATATLLGGFVRGGRTGVDIFFVLSGFLLSLPFILEAGGGPRVDLRRYAIRRVRRIVPLYATVVVVATLLTAATAADLLRALPYLLFVDGFVHVRPMLPYSAVWWSLRTEVQFYTVLPLVVLLLRARHGWPVAALLLVAYAAAYAAYVTGRLVVPSIDGMIALQASLFGRAPFFLGGALAAWLYARRGEALRRRLVRSAWARGSADLLLLAVLAALALFLQWVVALGARDQLPAYQARDLIEAAAWTTVLLFLLLAPLRTRWLFSNPLLARLGVISYSVYLIHNPVLCFGVRAIHGVWTGMPLAWTPQTVPVVVLLGAVCVALAELTFRGIEQPFQRAPGA